MKQTNLWGEDIKSEFASKIDSKYTAKIGAPVYEPKNKKPHILECYDNIKSNRLINDIHASGLPDDEKRFLIEAAKRHTVFNYSKIADYYSHASKEMQALMERSALVIIDFEKAILCGYVKLNDDITQNYLNDYDDK